MNSKIALSKMSECNERVGLKRSKWSLRSVILWIVKLHWLRWMHEAESTLLA